MRERIRFQVGNLFTIISQNISGGETSPRSTQTPTTAIDDEGSAINLHPQPKSPQPTTQPAPQPVQQPQQPLPQSFHRGLIPKEKPPPPSAKPPNSTSSAALSTSTKRNNDFLTALEEPKALVSPPPNPEPKET